MAQIDIFVINLASSRARRAVIERVLGRAGLAYRFIEAVDGYALGDAEYAAIRQASVGLTRKWPHKKPISRGEAGCALSHLKCYETILREGIDHALIMEDDTLIKNLDNLRWILERDNLAALGKRVAFDLIYCCLYFARATARQRLFSRMAKVDLRCRWGKVKLRPGLVLAKPCCTFYGTVGYIVNQRACKILLAEGRRQLRPADMLTACADMFGLRQYYLKPFPLGPNIRWSSLIGDENRFYMEIKKKKSPLVKGWWWWLNAGAMLFPLRLLLRKLGVNSMRRIARREIYYD